MAEQKLSERTQTTSGTGGFVHIIRDLGSGFQSFRISVANLLQPVTSLLSTIQTNLENRLRIGVVETSTDTTFTMPANSKLEGVDVFWVSVEPVVKIGTTDGGDEVLFETTYTEGEESVLKYKLFPSGGTLFIKCSGGSIKININYREL